MEDNSTFFVALQAVVGGRDYPPNTGITSTPSQA
jgi:hypothetical protein